MNNFLEHVPVLLDEILENLKKFKITDGIIIDATFGLGGYSNAILENTNCEVYGFDRDPEVLKYANRLKERYKKRFNFFQKKFSEIDEILSEPNHSKKKIRAIIFDLGVSNLQLTKKSRGFSFKLDGPLDMRMSKKGIKALDVINNYSTEKLADIIYKFGDEVFSKSINLAKWNIYVVALADCSFYVFSKLICEKNLKHNDCKEVFINIIENERNNGLDEEIFNKAKNDFLNRLEKIDFKKYYLNEPFKESGLALLNWSPIADELKNLDKLIVLNSIKLKWNLIVDEFDKLTKNLKFN